ncbi:MAG: hypothetical protein LBR18_01670, partial [Tannerella sp.]|nr:hypothetical protein [Tannerella sp.]
MQFLEQLGLQGDTQWFSVDKIPEDAFKIETRFIAASEKSVHALCGKYDMYEGLDGVIYVDVHEECVLNHTYHQNLGVKGYNRTVTLPEKDHRHSVIAPGQYSVGIRKRFFPFPLHRRNANKQSEEEIDDFDGLLLHLLQEQLSRETHGVSLIYVPAINPDTFLRFNWSHSSCRLRDYSGYTGYPLFEHNPLRVEKIDEKDIKYEIVMQYVPFTDIDYWHQKTKEINEQYGVKPSKAHVHLGLSPDMYSQLAMLAKSNG